MLTSERYSPNVRSFLYISGIKGFTNLQMHYPFAFTCDHYFIIFVSQCRSGMKRRRKNAVWVYGLFLGSI